MIFFFFSGKPILCPLNTVQYVYDICIHLEAERLCWTVSLFFFFVECSLILLFSFIGCDHRAEFCLFVGDDHLCGNPEEVLFLSVPGSLFVSLSAGLH